MAMSFETFVSDVVATLLGGVVLALLFFWAREKLFPLPQITGRWYFELRTINTSYAPYTNMILRYIAMLWREGSHVEGTVEKIYENSSTGERSYVGVNRTRGIIKGYIEKNYFGKDRLFLHVIEEGHGRESTNFYELSADFDQTMTGLFSSTVADQKGDTRWQRNKF